MLSYVCEVRFRIHNFIALHDDGLFPLPESDSDSDSKPDGYIVLCRSFSTAQIQIRIPFLNGYCTHFRDGAPSKFYYISIRGSESKSKPVEKFCIVQESKSESYSGSGNKPLLIGNKLLARGGVLL